MSCPYSSEELDYWDGVCNPMGEACNDCGEYECEHNPNSDFAWGEEDFRVEIDINNDCAPD